MIVLGGTVALCFLALLTWIAIRVDQLARAKKPKPTPPCRRVHIGDLPTELFLPDLAQMPRRTGPPRRDEEESNPQFPAPRFERPREK